MKKRHLLSRQLFAIAGLISLAAIGPRFVCAAEEKGNLELLKRVAAEYRANRDRIHTWRGRSVVRESPSKEGIPSLPLIRTVDFVGDYVNGPKFWAWSAGPQGGSKKGEKVEGKTKHESKMLQGGVLAHGVFYESTGLKAKDRRNTEMFDIRHPTDVAFGPRSFGFDPMYFMSDYAEDVADRFIGLEQLAKAHPDMKLTVSEQGTRVLVRQGDESKLHGQYVADLAYAGNLTEITNGDTRATDRVTVEYMQVDGIWVPRRYVLTRQDAKHTPLVHVEIEWTQNVLNAPVSPDQFTLKALGAQKGDLILDIRSQAFFHFDADRAAADAGKQPK